MSEQKKPRKRKEIFVRPLPGMRVKHPVSFAVLPAEGMLVEDSSYWTRRILDGDVEKIEVPSAPVKEHKKGKE